MHGPGGTLRPISEFEKGVLVMRCSLLTVACFAAAAILAGCSGSSMETGGESTSAETAGNVLLAEWTGPHGGLPAFDRMDLDAVKPALEAGMASNLAEVDRIADHVELSLTEILCRRDLILLFVQLITQVQQVCGVPSPASVAHPHATSLPTDKPHNTVAIRART